MTTEADYKLMNRDLMRKLQLEWGEDEFQRWWNCNIVALNGIIYWDHKTLFGVLNAEYQCVRMLHERYFPEQYMEELLHAQEWREQMVDERPV